jgi:[protein-PII] uridylyltransferase
MSTTQEAWKLHIKSLGASGLSGLALGRAHAEHLARQVVAGLRLPPGTAVAAVGGLGRSAVAPAGDADLWLLTEQPLDALAPDEHAILYALWDSGIPVSHQWMQVARVGEACAEDLRTETALLDIRHLHGPTDFIGKVTAAAFDHTFALAALAGFFARLEQEVRHRHARFGGSVYLLEPDIKHGPGGMRDLDCARWTARARYHVCPRSAGFAQELVKLGVFVPREAHELEAAEQFLWKLRVALHLRAGRRSDRLTFDAQEALARSLGYVAVTCEPESEQLALGVEQLMQDYYVHARVVVRARESLAQRCLPTLRRSQRVKERQLGDDVVAFDERVAFSAVADLSVNPASALRLFAVAAATGLAVFPAARELCVRQAPDQAFGEKLRASTSAAALFLDLMCDARKPAERHEAHAEAIHETGLLLAMIPEFAPVTGRVHHDLYHVYTVDVHSVAALRVLAQLRRGEPALGAVAEGEAVDDALPRRLAAEVVDPRALCLATLLHDVGKGYPDANGSRSNHSARGAELARPILTRLGMPEAVIREVVTLVAQHLALYHLATRRDLDDVQTTVDCAAIVGTREVLRNLYLLTLADLRTTSPKALTAWKARMLEELYLRTDRYLDDAIPAPEQDERARLAGALHERGIDEQAAAQFVASFPLRYAATVEDERAAEHFALSVERGSLPFAVRCEPLGDGELLRVTVLADDEPGLLARLASALWAARLSVLSAQLYSRVRSTPLPAEAVDVFYVRGSSGRTFEPQVLRALLQRVLGERQAPESLVGSMSPTRTLSTGRTRAPQVLFDDRPSVTHTIVEVFGRDRPGLMYALARTFAQLGLAIAVAKINTEGDRVADVFYVTRAHGAKLTDSRERDAVRVALLAVLEPGAAPPVDAEHSAVD